MSHNKEYAEDRLSADLAVLEICRDKVIGTSTIARDGYQQLINDINDDGSGMDHSSVARVRSLRYPTGADRQRAARTSYELPAQRAAEAGDT